MRVVFNPEVEHYLFDLVEILYKKGYFGFAENAVQYVESLVYEIINTLPQKIKKPVPNHFKKYGRGLYYSVFKKNNNTQWYVFFNREDDIYYVRYIGNNHTCARYLD